MCTEFDPADVPVSDFEDYDDEDDDYVVPSEEDLLPDDFHLSLNILEETADKPSYDLPGQMRSSTVDLNRINGVNAIEESEPVVCDESLDSLAYYRFGFTKPYASVSVPDSRKPKWDLVRIYLGNGWNPPSYIEKSLKDPLCVFFAFLVDAKAPRDMPVEILDLVQQNGGAVMHAGNIRVCYRRFHDTAFYFMEPRNYDARYDSWQLVLKSAASALECLRRGWGPHCVDIAKELLDRGIPFHTYNNGPPPSSQLSRPTISVDQYRGLGYRPYGYVPTAIDYLSYERRRDSFLLGARGRAALMVGGIVSRLAKEALGYDDVLLGPSDKVFDGGGYLWDGISQQALWDDELTAEEMDLICGVYDVATGECSTYCHLVITYLLWNRSI